MNNDTKTIPTPKAENTRLGNDTCLLAITYNPTRKATKIIMLRIVNNIKRPTLS